MKNRLSEQEAQGRAESLNKKLYSSSRYLTIILEIAQASSYDVAAAISFLTNHCAFLEGREAVVWDGEFIWFRCSTKLVRRELGFSTYKHHTIFKFLSDEGVIKRKMIGNPAKRYIAVDYDAIHRLCNRGYIETHGG